jgi:signal transduction histidine kinase
VSIRSRLAIAVALVLLITFVLLGVVLVRSTRATLISQVDQQVITNADRANVGGKQPGGGKSSDDNNGSHDGSAASPPASNSSSVKGSNANGSSSTLASYDERTVARFVYTASGALIVNEPCGFVDAPKSPPLLPAIPGPGIKLLYNKIVTTPSVDSSLSYRTFVQQDAGGNIHVTAASLESVNDAVSRLERIFLLFGGIALVITTLVAYGLIRRGLRPVDQMVETAAAIAGGNLSLRVPEANPRTELGQLGGALNNMLHRIENAVQARAASEERLRRFIGDAAHELRTPLTSVRGYAELYRQGAIHDPESVGKAMGRIEAEGSRMARLVDEMLLLARLDQQRGLDMKPVDLVTIAKEALADFAAVEPDRPLTDELAPMAVVSGDRLRLRQVIDNLLANARVHTPARTPVNLKIAIEGKEAVMTVSDKGPGITEEDRERVFERFWRADPARVRSRGGSGLGLSIVASLVESHGGAISVESEPGKGAAFIVRLPLAEGT